MEPMEFHRCLRPSPVFAALVGSSESGGNLTILIQSLIMEPMDFHRDPRPCVLAAFFRPSESGRKSMIIVERQVPV